MGAAARGGPCTATLSSVRNQMSSVTLYIYDLSDGMARTMSGTLLGRQIDAIYHTSVVVFGLEYFYGGEGITALAPKTTPYGTPIEEIPMGETSMTKSEWDEYILSISPRFRLEDYHFMRHNCNSFTSEACQRLVGKDIPEKIRNLPDEFMDTPLGKLVAPMIDQLMGTAAAPQPPTRLQAPQPPPRSPAPAACDPFPCVMSNQPIVFTSNVLATHAPQMAQPLERAGLFTEDERRSFLEFLRLELRPALEATPRRAAPGAAAQLERIARALPALRDEEAFPLIDVLRLVCLLPGARAHEFPGAAALQAVCVRVAGSGAAHAGLCTMAARYIANSLAAGALPDTQGPAIVAALTTLLRAGNAAVVKAAAVAAVNLCIFASTASLVTPAPALAAALVHALRSSDDTKVQENLARASGRLIAATFGTGVELSEVFRSAGAEKLRQLEANTLAGKELQGILRQLE
eukprot:gnl/Chilomastix_cuspidata/3063.p1 GENE.gnl/Chilomastix_cuspidata/3063~~gnl/Chilomastix_cuspidata/3063.p1  ORF type:complete len:462 (-),score=100.92 gnl/Chilomastix_cuspidata/3063:83-1468(-)